MANNKTQVIFLLEKDSASEVWALFPETKYTRKTAGSDSVIYECYSHIGQHSECTIDYLIDCKFSPVELYQPLKTELESIGYNLSVII